MCERLSTNQTFEIECNILRKDLVSCFYICMLVGIFSHIGKQRHPMTYEQITRVVLLFLFFRDGRERTRPVTTLE